MLRALFYPLVAMGAILLLAVVCVVVIGVQRWREHRAVRNARWEPYTLVRPSGIAEVGVRLVARWGHQHRVLQDDENPTEAPTQHAGQLLDAQGAAVARADIANSTHWKVQQ